MAIAILPDGKQVDLHGARIHAGPNSVAVMLLEFGDNNGNKIPDVTVTAGAKLPFMGDVGNPPFTADIPLDQALALADGVLPALRAVPGPGAAFADELHKGIAVVRGLTAVKVG